MRNRYGTIAIFLGLIGICVFGIVLGPLAVIFGKLGLKRDEENVPAIIGLIFGFIVTALWIIGIILLIIFLSTL